MKKIFAAATLVITLSLFCLEANASTKVNALQKTSITQKSFNEWGSFTGYLLFNDGCYRHGTFLWSGSQDNYIFIYDGGCNNSGACSVGFEDFCMGDDQWDSFC